MSAIALDPLIAEAKERARRRRLLALAAAGLLVACGAGVELAQSGSSGGTPGTIPWIAAKPSVGPAHPPLAPPCSASQLEASLSLQGAGMSWGGPITLVNRSSERCSLLGRPKLSFAQATSRWKETHLTASVLTTSRDPLAPPRGSLRSLAPGEHVSVMLWWSNWCGAGARTGGVLTKAPRAIVLAAPGGGSLHLTRAEPGGRTLPSPVCNGGPGSVSVLQAAPFVPFAPQGAPSTALPLKASILSQGHSEKGARPPAGTATLVGRAGGWLSFTVALKNTSRHAFRFGRRCPAYTEGVIAQSQAYVLNCHAVGAIAPHQSVRFAMRVYIPAKTPSSYALGWTLAPHSFNAPYATAVVELH